MNLSGPDEAIAPRDTAEYHPAGIVTRLLAAAVDTVTVVAAEASVYLVLSGILFIVAPTSFHWPQLPALLTGLLGAAIAVVYLAVCWATIGRTYGASLLGLRVLSADRRMLGWPRAVLRSVCCVIVPVGLLWAMVSRRRRSLQDILVRSVVVYDWNRDGGLRATMTGTAGVAKI
ncbi:MAG TPA: RDD family protein [Pseudonocardiaceae bacterium]|nr:RDD family protein [Pseudonocardiaceae bacterium]